MYVRMCDCMYVYMCVCWYVCMFVCTYVCICAQTYMYVPYICMKSIKGVKFQNFCCFMKNKKSFNMKIFISVNAKASVEHGTPSGKFWL